jgi:hypothetical protein
MIFGLAALLAVGGILVWLLLGDAAGAMSLLMPAILLVSGGAMHENAQKRRAQQELREKTRDRSAPPAPLA